MDAVQIYDAGDAGRFTTARSFAPANVTAVVGVTFLGAPHTLLSAWMTASGGELHLDDLRAPDSGGRAPVRWAVRWPQICSNGMERVRKQSIRNVRSLSTKRQRQLEEQ